MKRIGKGRIIAGALLLVAMLALYGWHQLHGTPDYYTFTLTPQQREDAVRSATNKLAQLQNAAASAAAAILRRTRHPAATTAPDDPPDTTTVSFSGIELNAFFQKWADFEGWKTQYEREIEGPLLVLRPGKIMFAANVKSLHLVASVELQPRINEQGRLETNLDRVRAGDLPVPQEFFSGYRSRMRAAVVRRMPTWQATARLKDDGSANSAAICATLGELFINTLDHQDSEPIIFLPVIDRGSIPVRLIALDVGDDSLTLTIRPLSGPERSATLAWIRSIRPVGP